MFSGYTLADVSTLSVVAMPITTQDLLNGEYYTSQQTDVTRSADAVEDLDEMENELATASPLSQIHLEYQKGAESEIFSCNRCKQVLEHESVAVRLGSKRIRADCYWCNNCQILFSANSLANSNTMIGLRNSSVISDAVDSRFWRVLAPTGFVVPIKVILQLWERGEHGLLKSIAAGDRGAGEISQAGGAMAEGPQVALGKNMNADGAEHDGKSILALLASIHLSLNQ
ncbi:hypothetical protein QBC38DRAFT_172181 [Podospora fimiseda]|uniref:Uncharacterized protein n=1 Tax=Podospora fimiseda TaxID=252190 RepID=A0AAN7BGB4_9PEZI|nr:hypothetical protein QBC38DRAFT_172181 [Podospora fimiseda]